MEDQRDDKDQALANQGRQDGEDNSYNTGRGQIDSARTLVLLTSRLRERSADLVKERERISQRVQAFLEERTKFTRPPDPVGYPRFREFLYGGPKMDRRDQELLDTQIKKISAVLAPRRADDTGNNWSVPRWHDRGGLPGCGVSRPADDANGF